MKGVGGMVLAAGLSQRMDGSLPKQLLPVGAIALAALSVRQAEASRLDRVVVVTGYRAGEVAAAVVGGRAEIVENTHYRSGNMSSFRAGAAPLEGCEAVVVLLADMPGLTTPMIDRIIDEWYFHQPWAARCVYSDGPGHPLLLSAAAVRKAVDASGPKGVWRLLESESGGEVREIRFGMPAPADVNTRADYERLVGHQTDA